MTDPEDYLRDHPEIEKELKNLFKRIKDKQLRIEDPREAVQTGLPGIVGDFKIIREIGRGGMGTVYEAVQLSLHRRVALKVLPPHLSYSDAAVRKFHREAEAGGRQSHPGIVAIHAVGKHEDLHYIAQEFVEGSRTLADLVEEYRGATKQPPGTFREMAVLFAEIAKALQHAHDTGVIHRDIKPSNILITSEGYPKITDFGLARVEDALELSRTGELAGTPYYMSPEQAMSRRIGIDHRTDIYSLGVTLYEMLTSTRPFDGDTSQEVLKKIILQDPRSPRMVNNRVPRDMAVICLKAMEKKPEARYSSMRAFADDLGRYYSGDVIQAKSAGPFTRVMKRLQRNPAAGAAVGVAAGALIALLVWCVVYFIQWGIKNEEISRLSDIDSMFRLRSEAEELWPAYPETIPKMQRWLSAVRDLESRLEKHRRLIADFQRDGKTDPEEAVQQGRLETYVKWLESIRREPSGLGAQVQHRMRFAETVHQRSIEDHEEKWKQAVAFIKGKYKGLRIKPLPGFVPIGPDPVSGLYEFAHIETGAVPKRGEGRRLELGEETGLVFVLIPGDMFNMGAVRDNGDFPPGTPNVDPYADEDNENPVHRVNIKPFLLSKYEMTQAQWLKMSGANPSHFQPGKGNNFTLLHPVEMVSWNDCVKWMRRLKLRLPTESEWEYAARAGTTSVWWSGNEKESLIGKANMADLSCKQHCDLPVTVHEEWLDDGYTYTAPIGSFAANPFGLHDVCGNVIEWCQDFFADSYDHTPIDGSAYEAQEDNAMRVCRGGDWFNYGVKGCRSSFRGINPPGQQGFAISVRPAADLNLD